MADALFDYFLNIMSCAVGEHFFYTLIAKDMYLHFVSK